MQELAQREGIAARALEFAILTGARTDQAITAPWSEIDFDAKVWTIPASRMKAGKELRVPLSDQALDILRNLPREAGNDFIFISPSDHRQGLSNAAMSELLGRMHTARAWAGLPPWVDKTTGKLAVVHGFRSTFRDWAGERTNYPNHVVEMALAHTISSKVERAYQRRDLYTKRTCLMADWAKYATTPQASGDVDTSLNERRKARRSMKPTPNKHRVDLLWLFERLVKGPADAGEEYVDKMPTDLALYILELAKAAPWPPGPHPKSRAKRNRESLAIMRAKCMKRELEKERGLSAGEALVKAAKQVAKGSLADRGAILDAIQNEYPGAVEQNRLIRRGRQIAEELGTLAPDQLERC